jgi:hypothetical protein
MICYKLIWKRATIPLLRAGCALVWPGQQDRLLAVVVATISIQTKVFYYRVQPWLKLRTRKNMTLLPLL